jgi:hypothetical protein
MRRTRLVTLALVATLVGGGTGAAVAHDDGKGSLPATVVDIPDIDQPQGDVDLSSLVGPDSYPRDVDHSYATEVGDDDADGTIREDESGWNPKTMGNGRGSVPEPQQPEANTERPYEGKTLAGKPVKYTDCTYTKGLVAEDGSPVNDRFYEKSPDTRYIHLCK